MGLQHQIQFRLYIQWKIFVLICYKRKKKNAQVKPTKHLYFSRWTFFSQKNYTVHKCYYYWGKTNKYCFLKPW
uniref:Uncharacterized protein n=1 Tax=Anguilla anguilla TaxID=7936 RepID=A0A0E9XGR9_ANGAN